MNHEIVESFAQMAREKGIDKDILIGIVEDIFGMMVKKKYGPGQLKKEQSPRKRPVLFIPILKKALLKLTW